METYIKARTWGFKPYAIASYGDEKVELISYPIEDHGQWFIMARRVIGDPTTMERLPIAPEFQDFGTGPE